MGKYTLVHGLDRARGSDAIIEFRINGTNLSLLILETCDEDDEWSGEVGSVTADECLTGVDTLKAWVKHPRHHPNGDRDPCELELSVKNFGTVRRMKGDDDAVYGEPHPDIERLTILVMSDRDARALIDYLREANQRMRFGP
jgi:hypothetical protein